MCGIFGIVTKDGSISRGVLENAASALAHRGPDDSGSVVVETSLDGNRQVGFAHTRLSIIDLSPLGHQPMRDPASGNWIVFNGEIYNFRELRAELEAAGNRFQSHSDTEVILAAYRIWGAESFDRLRGMFAFALWDASRQTLLLVRDSMGIKPLYYYDSGKCFLIFFRGAHPAKDRPGAAPASIRNGLFSFLAFGSVYEPRTIIEGISAVPPGHIVSLEKDGVTSLEYWNPLAKINSDSEAGSRGGTSTRQTSANGNATKNLTTLLRDAVLSHLVSDVPVGVFLSGGIDSSSLVALMSSAGTRATTFSLVFREAEFDEGEYSRLVARRFGTDHHELMVSQQDALSAVPDALSAMDQPTIDGINTCLVSAKARAAGVKVALTGLGADEMFAGYSNFRDVPRLERVSAGFTKCRPDCAVPWLRRSPHCGSKSDRGRKMSQLASELAEDENAIPHNAAHKAAHSVAHPYFVTRNLFTPAERQALYARRFRKRGARNGGCFAGFHCCQQ